MRTDRSSRYRRMVQIVALIVAGSTAAHSIAHAEKQGARGQSSPTWLVVNHKVENYDRWKPVFDSTAALKRKFDWKQSTVYSVDGDRNNVTVMEEFGSLEGAKGFASTPELKAAMAKAGVVGAPDIHFISSVAHSKN